MPANGNFLDGLMPLRVPRHRVVLWLLSMLLVSSTVGCSSVPAGESQPGPRLAGCTNQTAGAAPLPSPAPGVVAVPGHPFAVLVAPGGHGTIVSLDPDKPGNGSPDLAVVAAVGAKPTLVRTVSLPGGGGAAGMAISHDGRYLAVTMAGGTGSVSGRTAVLSLPSLLAGSPNPVLGMLDDHGIGPIEAVFSRDDRYVFVSDEYGPTVSVFNLATALSEGFDAPGVSVGKVPMDAATVGLALSPDGRRLYVTSEVATSSSPRHGTLAVLDVDAAEQHPVTSVMTRVAAGCQPVRVAVSADGNLAWVTARGSNALLAFDTAQLLARPQDALRAVVAVGRQPVGLLLTSNDRYALVANSSRYTQPNNPQTVSVVDTTAALSGRPALIGTIPAGAFPRQLDYDPATRQVVLANYGSNTVETFRSP
jgi:DNA-binding beta-propeller fold protein YncE